MHKKFLLPISAPCTVQRWNAFECLHVARMRLIRIETVTRGSMRCGGRMRFKERVEQPYLIVNLGERRRGSWILIVEEL